MRSDPKKEGILTVRAIAGTTGVLLAMDLADPAGCLGFSIHRTDLGTPTADSPESLRSERWLPNLLRFPKDNSRGPNGSDVSPIQKFWWGDYAVHPGHRYKYRVLARGGTWDKLQTLAEVEVEVTTEDPLHPECSVYFNRGAAASEAYVRKFGTADPGMLPAEKREQAFTWLSRGLQEGLLAFMDLAASKEFGLRAAIYEFEKPELLAGLLHAKQRGADVEAVYHARQKGAVHPDTPGATTEEVHTDREGKKVASKDHTFRDNVAAAKANGVDGFSHPRSANPQGAIMHNKFVVLLRHDKPIAVWTGSTNWTEGGIYGQLNVGHAIFDVEIASQYLKLYKLLRKDAGPQEMKAELGAITPVPASRGAIKQGITPIFSPQSGLSMLELYADICKSARTVLVCAPFELHDLLKQVLVKAPDPKQLRYMLLDTSRSLGKGQDIAVVDETGGSEVAAAATLSTPFHDFQNRLLLANESFHHKGIHIHSKIILADPLGDDPILVTGSANFSKNSTETNDSNSLIIRGNKRTADVYLTEFMRMFEHYHFRSRVARRAKLKPDEFDAHAVAHSTGMGLSETDDWSRPYYQKDSTREMARKMFSGA